MNWNLRNRIPLTEFLTSADDYNYNYLEKLLRESETKKTIEAGLIELIDNEEIYLIAEKEHSFTVFGTRGYLFSGFLNEPVQKSFTKKARKLKYSHLPAVITIGGKVRHGEEVHRAYWPPETITVLFDKPLEDLKARIGHNYLPKPTAWIIHNFDYEGQEDNLLGACPQASITCRTRDGIKMVTIEPGHPIWNMIARPIYEPWENLNLESTSIEHTNNKPIYDDEPTTSTNITKEVELEFGDMHI